MEKLIYLSWKRDGLTIEAYREHLLEEVAQRILAAGACALNVSVADTQQAIPKPTLLMGEGATLSAAVAVWMQSLDDRGPVEEALREQSVRLDGYLVTESVPQPCLDRDWADGAPSPGVTHFTWFPKPERLSDEAFYHGWHVVHTPASAELHPLRWEYVRNAVARVLTPGSPPIRAIVAERFRDILDYTDPSRLYGSPEALKRTVEELPLYGDMEAMHSTPLSEVIVKSLGS
ncbi:MAG: hypothetical protein GY937_13405 [bacterium]|nr:hypothetical protein [bacterium]